MKALLLLLIPGSLLALGSVVQSKTCNTGATPTNANICVMPSNVTSGNLLVVLQARYGTQCIATLSDTLGLTFTQQATVINAGGFQSGVCIKTAPITSSGPDTVTQTTSNQGQFMWVFEVAGMPSPTFSSSTATASSASSIDTGNVTATAANSLLVCVENNNATNVTTAATPAASVTDFSGVITGDATDDTGASLYKFVGAGTTSCVFTIGGSRLAAAAVMIESATVYTPKHKVISQ